MRTLTFTDQARTDLLAIGIYTDEHWSETQSLRYVQTLRIYMDKLPAMPYLGRPYDEVDTGLRKLTHEHHAIFYKVRATEIRIIAILHQSQDPTRHLA